MTLAGILTGSSKTKGRIKATKRTHILQEDKEILEILVMLKEDLDYVHHCLDITTDPILIDSYIYEIQSINMRYQFYMQQCKERGLSTY